MRFCAVLQIFAFIGGMIFSAEVRLKFLLIFLMIFLSKMMSIPFKILFIIFVYFESFKFIFWFFFLALRPIPCSFKTRTIIIWFLPIIFYIFDLFMAGMPLMMVPVMI